VKTRFQNLLVRSNVRRYCKARLENAGKDVTSTDDLTFLSAMVAHIVHSGVNYNTTSVSAAVTGRVSVDPERVYATGFSMGCMMAHRLAMERSAIIAGFGCHGGMLVQSGSDLPAQKKRFCIQPMPA
jgi:dienelactone hydrolase